MKLRRYIIEPRSPWASPLRGDTLAGLLLWRLAEDEGEEACAEALAAFRAGEPPFEVSSAMPLDCLPMPCLPPARRGVFRAWYEKGRMLDAGATLFEALQKYKKFRKLPWLPLDVWLKNASSLNVLALFNWFCADAKVKVDKKGGACETRAFRARAAIDRASGSAADGALFFTPLTYFAGGLCVYARSREPEKFLAGLRRIGEIGFGGGASVGCGRFAAWEDEKFDPAPLENAGEWRVTLSPCASANMGAIEGFYRAEVKHGKVGPGMGSPFKYPFVYIEEGALLRTLPEGPWILDNICPNAKVAQALWPVTLPCEYREET